DRQSRHLLREAHSGTPVCSPRIIAYAARVFRKRLLIAPITLTFDFLLHYPSIQLACHPALRSQFYWLSEPRQRMRRRSRIDRWSYRLKRESCPAPTGRRPIYRTVASLHSQGRMCFRLSALNWKAGYEGAVFPHLIEWAMNIFVDREFGDRQSTSAGFAQSVEVPVLLPEEKLEVGLEMQYRSGGEAPGLEGTTKGLAIGPTLAWRPTKNARFD